MAERRSGRVAEMMARYLGEFIMEGFARDDVTEIYVQDFRLDEAFKVNHHPSRP